MRRIRAAPRFAAPRCRPASPPARRRRAPARATDRDRREIAPRPQPAGAETGPQIPPPAKPATAEAPGPRPRRSPTAATKGWQLDRDARRDGLEVRRRDELDDDAAEVVGDLIERQGARAHGRIVQDGRLAVHALEHHEVIEVPVDDGGHAHPVQRAELDAQRACARSPSCWQSPSGCAARRRTATAKNVAAIRSGRRRARGRPRPWRGRRARIRRLRRRA